MLRRIVGVSGIWMLLCLTGTAWGADHPLAAFPSDVSLVIQLKSPNATIEKAAGFADAIQDGMGNQVRFGGQAIGAMISNPTRDGVDNDANWWVGVFVSQESEPSLMFAIPASDHDMMRDALGEDVTYVKYEKWGVYCDEEEIGQKIKSLVNGKGKSLESLVTKASQDVLGRADLTLFLNLQELRTVYQPQLDQFRNQIQQSIEELQENGVQQNPQIIATVKPVMGMMKSLMTALNDLESCTIGLGIGKTDVKIEDILSLKSDSATSKFLGTPAGSEMDVLNKLPSDSLVYFGMHADNQWLVKWGMEFVRDLAKDPAIADQFDELLKEHQKLNYGAIVGSFQIGTPETGAFRSVGLTEVDRPDQLRELYTKLMELMSKVQFGPENVKITYDLKKAAEKYGEYTADVLTTEQQIDGNDPAIEIQKQVNEALYGPEGMVARLVYTDHYVLQTTGGGKAAMFGALENLNAKSPKPNAPLEAARKMHHEKVSAIAFADLAGILVKGAKFMMDSGTLPPNAVPKDLLKMESSPSYVGFSLNLEKAALRSLTVIPVQQIKTFVNGAIHAQRVPAEEF